MSPRAAALATVTALAPVALVVPAAAAAVDAQAAGDGSLRITGSGGGVLARAAWHESGDVLCVHATKRDAIARFRTSSGRLVSATDRAGGSYWSCVNLDVPEDDRVRLVLRWKTLGIDHYARTVSTHIRT